MALRDRSSGSRTADLTLSLSRKGRGKAAASDAPAPIQRRCPADAGASVHAICTHLLDEFRPDTLPLEGERGVG